MGSCNSNPPPAAAAQPKLQPVDGIPQAGPGPLVKKDSKFQIMLSQKWEDYKADEDAVLKRAYLVGQPNCRFSLRGQKYEYNFKSMKQVNQGTGKERDIRPPQGMTAPKKPLLPTGSMTVIKVRPGQAGKMITIDDPNNPGKKIKVNVPKGAKVGQKMAVPIPEKGETIADVQKKQKSHSAGAKLLMGTAGVATVGALAVGGVILGEHLSDGAVSDAAGDAFGDGAADAISDATAWVEGAVADFPEWAEGVGEDIVDAGEVAIDWLGDAADDAGDFITSLF